VKSGTIGEIFWLLPVLSPLLLVVSHFSFVSTWKRSHFPLWFQSSGSPGNTVTSFGKAFAHVRNCLLKKKHMAQTKRDNREKWWEYREKSKYFSNCTTFHIRRALSWHLYVIMYLLCIKVYSKFIIQFYLFIIYWKIVNYHICAFIICKTKQRIWKGFISYKQTKNIHKVNIPFG
jgi:hypothetical protein